MTSKAKIEEKYELQEILGRGTFSDVKKALDKTDGSVWAVKIMSKTGNDEDEDLERRQEIIDTEIQIFKTIKHKNVVNLREIYETSETYYLVLECITGGELFDKIVELTHYSERQASKIMQQIFEGIAHLHSKRVVHRDLKPENLLLSSDDFDADIKITDFGLSAIFNEEEEMKMLRAVGTPGYISPEILESLETNEPYGPETDIWSAGVIMYILLCGFPPFYGDDEEDVYDQICEGEYSYPSPYWDGISDAAKDLIDKCLVLNPKNRITAHHALRHPWIADENRDVNMESAITELKKFNARRKFKGAVKAIQALNKMSGGLRGLRRSMRNMNAGGSGK